LNKNTTQLPRPGLEPGPLDPESSALTVSSPRLPYISKQTSKQTSKQQQHAKRFLKRLFFLNLALQNILVKKSQTLAFEKVNLLLFFT